MHRLFNTSAGIYLVTCSRHWHLLTLIQVISLTGDIESLICTHLDDTHKLELDDVKLLHHNYIKVEQSALVWIIGLLLIEYSG